MPDFSYRGEWIAKGVHKAQWTILASGVPTGSGQHLNAPMLPDKTVYVDFGGVTGTSSVSIQGRNTATGAFVILQDDQNSDLTFTNDSIEVIMQDANEIRPIGGTVTAASGIVVTIISRAPLR